MHILEGDDICVVASGVQAGKSLPKDRTARDAHSAEPYLRGSQHGNSLTTRPLRLRRTRATRHWSAGATGSSIQIIFAGSRTPRGSELSSVEKKGKGRLEGPA
jgi:hypothetical protein